MIVLQIAAFVGLLALTVKGGIVLIKRQKAQSTNPNGKPPTNYFPAGLKPIKKRGR